MTTITELIGELERLRAEHGDIEVMVYDGCYDQLQSIAIPPAKYPNIYHCHSMPTIDMPEHIRITI